MTKPIEPTLEEAEVLLDWLCKNGWMTLNEAADAVNESIFDPERMAVNDPERARYLIFLACLNHLYARIEDFDPTVWPPGTAKVTWADFPEWVRILYTRANACGVYC